MCVCVCVCDESIPQHGHEGCVVHWIDKHMTHQLGTGRVDPQDDSVTGTEANLAERGSPCLITQSNPPLTTTSPSESLMPAREAGTVVTHDIIRGSGRGLHGLSPVKQTTLHSGEKPNLLV